ncbi:MAG: hypothetical protein ACAI25_11690 [Planctomycetota bacterium]
MTDEQLRAAERERDRGGLVAEARLLVERVRAGTFPAARLDLLAKIGDPRARLAVGLDPLDEQPLDDERRSFEERLAEAIVWGTERLLLGLTPRQVLRSRELRPANFEHGENESRSQLHGRSEWRVAIEHVARARRARLESGADEHWPPGSRALVLPEGSRLLLHDPRLQLFDGAAPPVSQELFDVDYMPPWDSWVAWQGATRDDGEWRVFDGYLVSWIPAELVALVQAAIDVSPSPTLAWKT